MAESTTPHNQDAPLRECTVCLENHPASRYPGRRLTEKCAHHPQSACVDCVSASIRVEVHSATPCDTTCPDCKAPLDYEVVEAHADAETFERYRQASLTKTITEAGNFSWCPLGCGSGQFHDDDNDNGSLSIVLCLGCKKQYCRRHQVAWHDEHTCAEYDAFLADPEGFLLLRAGDPRRRQQRDLDLASQQVRDAEHQFDLLLAGVRRDREEAGRRAELERLERQAALERARREAEARRKAEEEEAERQRQARLLQARKRAEEDATQAAFANRSFSYPVKPCPGCKAMIEKRGGWLDFLLLLCIFRFLCCPLMFPVGYMVGEIDLLTTSAVCVVTTCIVSH
ncbi:hypothetical protein SLS62_000511 [Diatrype stigma]|uniref:RING-type domain-containing protein n=1 Tax=Diatrype stigma TaxID=117547 RepID=A0AAN9V0W8_9PEZI